MDDIPKRLQRIYGNQYASRYGGLMSILFLARTALQRHDTECARYWLSVYRYRYAQAPASTRRRWKCGR